MAEDQERAARIADLKAQNPRLTWAKIAQEVGVSERAATRWQRTGALKPENAEELARLFDVDFSYIWVGPRPGTPEMFVDRRQEKPKPEGPVDVRLDAVEGALAQILTAMSTQLGAQTDTLATMNAALAQTLAALGQMNDTLDAIKTLLAKDVEVRDEVADLIDRRAREIADSAGESDPQPVPTPTVAAPRSPATARAAKPAKPRSR